MWFKFDDELVNSRNVLRIYKATVSTDSASSGNDVVVCEIFENVLYEHYTCPEEAAERMRQLECMLID